MGRSIFCLIMTLLLCFFVGCKPSIESKIEDEFMNYVQNNFDDPSSLQEIVNILPKDTAKIQEVFAMLKSTLEKDSLIISPSPLEKQQEMLKKINNLSYSEKRRLKRKAEEFIYDATELINFHVKHIDEYEYIKNSIIAHIDSIALTEKDFIYTYEIKVRIKEKGEKKLLSYYAILNADSNIRIQDHELKTEEVPVLKAVTDKIDRHLKLKEENLRLLKKAAESEREFSFLLN